ncbi:MAG: hypothetical protein AAB610_02045 [Patescibacteria group bacterium]
MSIHNINFRNALSKSQKFILIWIIVVSVPALLLMSTLIGSEMTYLAIAFYLFYILFVVIYFRGFSRKVTVTKDGRIISLGDKLWYKGLYKEVPENFYMAFGRVKFQFYFQISNIKNVYVTENPKRTSIGRFPFELFLVNVPRAVCFEFNTPLQYRDHLGNVNDVFPLLTTFNVSVAEPEKLVETVKALQNTF